MWPAGRPLLQGPGLRPAVRSVFIIHNDAVTGRPGRGTRRPPSGQHRCRQLRVSAEMHSGYRHNAGTVMCAQRTISRTCCENAALICLNTSSRDRRWCRFSFRDPAGSAIEVTDEGISQMKAHRQPPYVAKHARTVPAKGQAGAPRTDPVVRTTGGILALAFALGSIGAGVTELSGHGSAGHASAHQQAGNVRLAASASGVRISNRPWMW
jgi:hypothetical protein